MVVNGLLFTILVIPFGIITDVFSGIPLGFSPGSFVFFFRDSFRNSSRNSTQNNSSFSFWKHSFRHSGKFRILPVFLQVFFPAQRFLWVRTRDSSEVSPEIFIKISPGTSEASRNSVRFSFKYFFRNFFRGFPIVRYLGR